MAVRERSEPPLWALGTAAPSPPPGDRMCPSARPPAEQSSPERFTLVRGCDCRWAPSPAQPPALGTLDGRALWAHFSGLPGCGPPCEVRGAAGVIWIHLPRGYRGALKLEGPCPREHPAKWGPEAAPQRCHREHPCEAGRLPWSHSAAPAQSPLGPVPGLHPCPSRWGNYTHPL